MAPDLVPVKTCSGALCANSRSGWLWNGDWDRQQDSNKGAYQSEAARHRFQLTFRGSRSARTTTTTTRAGWLKNAKEVPSHAWTAFSPERLDVSREHPSNSKHSTKQTFALSGTNICFAEGAAWRGGNQVKNTAKIILALSTQDAIVDSTVVCESVHTATSKISTPPVCMGWNEARLSVCVFGCAS